MIDYDKLGFKAGLEIHQQLEGKKLYCNCPTLNTAEKPTFHVKRKLRAVVGETGEIDTAAAHEMSKGKTFVYGSHESDCCLIEYDEEPPRSLNLDAFRTAIEVSLLLNANPVDEIHIMRKIVVDGSNVSGFQRTALIAMNGYVETSKGRVGIASICLEEEAAQKLKATDSEVHYKLDRLGIPLIEIATDADIKDAEHAQEVAKAIGMVLRSVKGVKRGLGTIRQDVNVSIAKGSRVEIKGFQDLRSIPKVVDFEINRQLALVKKNKKVTSEVRKAEPDFTTSFLRPMPGAARLYPETDCVPVRLEDIDVKSISENLSELVGDKIERYKKDFKLPADLAKDAAQFDKFEDTVKQFSKVPPLAIAQTLFLVPKDLKSRLKLDITKLNQHDFEEVLKYLNTGKISKNAVADLLEKKIAGKKIDLSQYESLSDADVEKEIKKIVESKPGLNVGGYMGLVMGKFKGKIDGKQAMTILKKLVK